MISIWGGQIWYQSGRKFGEKIFVKFWLSFGPSRNWVPYLHILSGSIRMIPLHNSNIVNRIPAEKIIFIWASLTNNATKLISQQVKLIVFTWGSLTYNVTKLICRFQKVKYTDLCQREDNVNILKFPHVFNLLLRLKVNNTQLPDKVLNCTDSTNNLCVTWLQT